MAEAKRRWPARDSTRVGTAEGLHLPGILPEPETIEGQDRDWTPEEQAVLDDIDEALPVEDREDPVSACDDGEVAAVEMTRQRAQLPWWYGMLFFAGAAVSCLGAAWFSGPFAQRALFFVTGIAFAWLAAQSWNNRTRRT